jgi:[CysO sulfur-carrier protein]-S-L-cysteine hydrolase
LSTSFHLQIPRLLYEAMVAQAVMELPNECCGLLGGTVVEEAGRRLGRVVSRYALVNAAANPRLFESDARSMFAAMKDMRQRGMDVVAVYHSHPTSEPVPSRTDLERNYSEDVVNLIISLQDVEPRVRGWWLTASGYCEAEWEVVEAPELTE